MTPAAPALRPGPRPSRSRQEIVQCAMRLLDREGTGALTFRAVARELGITVGALSRYFRNLADLEDEVAAAIAAKLVPLDGKGPLRQQLLRMGMTQFEINRTHPYLVKIQGPASAAVLAAHTRKSLEVLTGAGIGFDRALAIYSLMGNLPYAWVAQNLQGSDPAASGIGLVYVEQLGRFAPQMRKLMAGATTSSIFRRWLLIYIDALLAQR